MNFKLILLFSTLIFLHCDKEEKSDIPQSLNYFEININPEEAKRLSIKQIVEDYSYLKLKIPDSLYFNSIQKILFDNDNVYMLDKSNFQDQILSFDLAGNFNFYINKPGRGPGEFESVYDFDISENVVLLSTPSGLKFYDKSTGAYIKTISNSKNLSIQSFEMLDRSLLVTESGRYKSNTSKKQLKVLDIEKDEIIREAISFNNYALKGSHSYRYLFRYNDTLSIHPMYDQTIYRVFEDNTGINVKSAYKVNFGEYWVPQDFLASSYKDLDTFYSEIDNYISNFEVFETEMKVYIDYKYLGANQTYIYDKKTGRGENLKLNPNNEIGWFGSPLATFNNHSIVNTISLQKEAKFIQGDMLNEIQDFFTPPNEQNILVIIFIQLP